MVFRGYVHFFASEIRAILQDESFKRTVDDRSVSDFILFRRILGTKTLVLGVNLLPPASIVACSNGRISTANYWEFNFRESAEHSEEYYIDRLSALLYRAVERQVADRGSRIKKMSRRAETRAYFRPEMVQRIVEDQIGGRGNNWKLITRLIILEAWHRTLIDRDSSQ